MKRRQFIQTDGFSLVSIFLTHRISGLSGNHSAESLLRYPDKIFAIIDNHLVDWDKNRQWMELLAKSGTPLFISAQPEATGSKQKESIRECFKIASKENPVGEPLDWIENPFQKIGC